MGPFTVCCTEVNSHTGSHVVYIHYCTYPALSILVPDISIKHLMDMSGQSKWADMQMNLSEELMCLCGEIYLNSKTRMVASLLNKDNRNSGIVIAVVSSSNRHISFTVMSVSSKRSKNIPKTFLKLVFKLMCLYNYVIFHEPHREVRLYVVKQLLMILISSVWGVIKTPIQTVRINEDNNNSH